MFAVIFETCPRRDAWETYLGLAKSLRPELEQIDGFVDNIRYRSLTREGWLLSLSSWRDEKALVRWRTQAHHHGAQEKGREAVFENYHLRVGEITRDSAPPKGFAINEHRIDETQVGEGTIVMLVDAKWPEDRVNAIKPDPVADWIGVNRDAAGLIAWDVFDAVLSPGEIIALMSWRDAAAVEAFAESARLPGGARLRTVRIVRDYGMFDRREAPQYYPDAARP
ncbi:MAG: antibiotic biosynthesis monooxygenase family protein [Rhizomicrobium sp.]